MTNIIERLRVNMHAYGIAQEAADEIERLRAEVAALKHALGTDWDGKSTLRMLTAERDRLRELLLEASRYLKAYGLTELPKDIDAALKE